MDKYLFINFRTRKFYRKTFEEQSENYVVADVVLEKNPSQILDVVAFWGHEYDEAVRRFELYGEPLPQSFHKPFYGEFVSVPSETPLLRKLTKDDVHRGLCSVNDIGSYVCNPDGSIRFFYQIKVFCIFNPAYIRALNDDRLKNVANTAFIKYQPKWSPEYRAKYQKRYCYVEATQKLDKLMNATFA